MKRVHVASSESSLVLDHEFAAAMATVVRAPPRDFMVVKQEWAAIRIQTAFRGLLVIWVSFIWPFLVLFNFEVNELVFCRYFASLKLRFIIVLGFVGLYL